MGRNRCLFLAGQPLHVGQSRRRITPNNKPITRPMPKFAGKIESSDIDQLVPGIKAANQK